MHTYSYKTLRPLPVVVVSLALIGLAGLLAVGPARAAGVECFSDDEAVVQCEAIAFTLEHRLKARQATCVENCATCGLQDLAEFETN